MVRRLAIPFAVLAALPAAAAAPADALPASVKLAACSAEDSSAAFYARMRAIDESERMWMRFAVLEKHLDRYEPLRAKGLSRWHRSQPGVGAFGYRQTVRGLQPGGVYRARVSFRWYSPEGELVGRTQRTSRPCRQFDEVPNLTSTVVGAEPTQVPGVFRYRVRASNTGVAPAAEVELRLSVDGGVVDTVTVASLEPGESREIAVLGPACAGSITSTADPDGVIVESSEADNGHTVDCQG